MKKYAAIICADDPQCPSLAEILAGLEEEGVPGEVITASVIAGANGIAVAGGCDPLQMAKHASAESAFGCGIGLCRGKAALFAGGSPILAPGDAAPRSAGKNAALYIKKERFELA